MGKWATHVGYELADAYLNRNYSMDYMFSYGPFSHTGLKADIGLGVKRFYDGSIKYLPTMQLPCRQENMQLLNLVLPPKILN